MDWGFFLSSGRKLADQVDTGKLLNDKMHRENVIINPFRVRVFGGFLEGRGFIQSNFCLCQGVIDPFYKE